MPTSIADRVRYLYERHPETISSDTELLNAYVEWFCYSHDDETRIYKLKKTIHAAGSIKRVGRQLRQSGEFVREEEEQEKENEKQQQIMKGLGYKQ